MSEIHLKIEKSKVPIIWLDTSIIFNISKWKRGDNLDSTTKKRMEFLHDQIHTLTRQKNLICPRADQDEEIWKNRQECLEMMLSLSLGIRAKYSEKIKDFQTRQFMEAFIGGKNEVAVDYRDFFRDDPVKQLNDNSDFVIDVDMGLLEEGNERQKRKQQQVIRLEKLRQSLVQDGVSYKEQLEKEYNAELDTLAVLLKRHHSGELSPLDTWSFLDIVANRLDGWNGLGGKPDELLKFYYSIYYRTIPMISISSRISAKLITGRDPIKSSHSMDIHHASSAIPYVDFFITDRNMKHILTDLGIDEEYQTIICNVGDSDQIEDFFNGI